MDGNEKSNDWLKANVEKVNLIGLRPISFVLALLSQK